MFHLILLIYLLNPFLSAKCQATESPHIVFILADDLGWNDVSWHGSVEIPTPNIDALAMGGLMLNRYYSQPICTPSRVAFLTGKYPIRTGMQHGLLKVGEPRGLPLTEKLLPEYLSSHAGYESHIIGKWHLGYYKTAYLPTKRGFTSHIGYWNGVHDYFDHTVGGPIGKNNHHAWGLDMRRNSEVAYDLHGKYSTDIFTDESVSVIEKHNKSVPLFLFVSQIAPHTGSTYNPLPTPEGTMFPNFEYIQDYDRRRYAEMITKLDEGVGKIMEALQKNNMLNNTIVVFASDNGGPVKGDLYMGRSAASNWPLKGSKRTLWEGGVRLAAAVWKRNLPNAVSDNLFHSTDWIPTLLSAAGVKNANISGLDGTDQWEAFLNPTVKSKKKEILLNYDTVDGHAAIINDQWKLIKGVRFKSKFDHNFGPERLMGNMTGLITKAVNSPTGQAIGLDSSTNAINQAISKIQKATIDCTAKSEDIKCNLSESSCLFNIFQDPCELDNVASKYPDIVSLLEAKLEKYKNESVPASNVPVPECVDPAYSNRVWASSYDDGQCNFASDLSPSLLSVLLISAVLKIIL